MSKVRSIDDPFIMFEPRERAGADTPSHCLANVKCLFFHKHNGKPPLCTCVFINIMASPETDIFTPFVFINIMGLTCIEGGPRFSLTLALVRYKWL